MKGGEEKADPAWGLGIQGRTGSPSLPWLGIVLYTFSIICIQLLENKD